MDIDYKQNKIETARKELGISLESLCSAAGIQDTVPFTSIHKTLNFPLLMKNLTQLYYSQEDYVRSNKISPKEVYAALHCVSKRIKRFDDLCMAEIDKLDAFEYSSSDSSPLDPERGIRQVDSKTRTIIGNAIWVRDDEVVDSIERAYDKIPEKDEFSRGNTLNLTKFTSSVAKKFAGFVEEFATNEEYLFQIGLLETNLALSRQSENVLLTIIDEVQKIAKQGQQLQPYFQRVDSILLKYYDKPEQILNAL